LSAPRLPAALLVASVGGVLGSLARYALTDASSPGLGFPWAVFAINVAGSAVLASLPLFAVVRRSPLIAVFLGTGVLGGFTTMSTASEQTVHLLEHGRTLTALVYCAGTLVAALGAAAVISPYSTPGERADLEAEGADE
jgi:CrcB protein